MYVISLKCRFCSHVQPYDVIEGTEFYIRSDYDFYHRYHSDKENFIDNGDGTFTSLSPNIQCNKCKVIWTKAIEWYWGKRECSEEKYFKRIWRIETMQEKQFWDEWNKNCLIDLIPQYRIQSPAQYRIDFVHKRTKTAIEIDGLHHNADEEQRLKDEERQTEIENLGWSFIRFSNDQIENDVDFCVVAALNFLGDAW
ncbi:MAG: endonuclease domain-containing protein [Ktedonobacteraceae bacterium]